MTPRPLLALALTTAAVVTAAAPAGVATAAAGACPAPPRPDAVRVLSSRQIAPGVTGTQLSFPSLAGRPAATGWLVRADLRTPGLAVDLLANQVTDSTQLARLAASRPRTVAAVNGDFFSFGGRGVAAGPEVRGAVVRKATSTPVPAFAVTGTRAALASVALTGVVIVAPRNLAVSAVNTEQPPRSGVAVFTGLWSGPVTGAARSTYVQIQGGRVVATSSSPVTVPSSGLVLVASGAEGRALAALRRGTGLRVGWRQVTTGGDATTALGVGPVLRRAGTSTPIGCAMQDEAPRPRTAVGRTADGHVLLLLVMQGAPVYQHLRSPGLGLRATQAVLAWAGAEEAAVLDGGGSAQMVTGRPLTSLTAPEDGLFRPVPNGLSVYGR